MAGLNRRRLAALSIVAAVAAWPLAVSAQQATTPSAEGAAALAGTLSDTIKAWSSSNKDKATLHWDGAVEVKPAGDGYDARLPALSVVDDDGGKLVVGTITATLKPNADGTWSFVGALPSVLRAQNAEGKAEGGLTIGGQKVTGVWAPKLTTLTKLDAALSQLTVTTVNDKAGATIGTITVRSDLNEVRPNAWSGPGGLTIADLAVTNEKGEPLFNLGQAGIEITLTEAELARFATAAATAGDDRSAGASAKKARDLVDGLLGGASFKLSLSGLSVAASSDVGAFSLKSAMIRAAAEGLNQDRSTLSLGYGHEGLKVATLPAEFPEKFMPEKSELAITFDKLPMKQLIKTVLISAIEEMMGPDEGGSSAGHDRGPMMAMQTLGALSSAGSLIRLEKLALETPALSASASGTARFDAKAANGLVASLFASLRGLETAMQALMPAPGGPPDESAQGILAMLGMVQALGQQAKDEAGREIRSYKLELGADGRMMLNGADLTALLGGGGNPPPSNGSKRK
ncbi:putative DUF945 domain-containing protein [uncultured Gammaproteobacteria bacterium]